MILVVRIFSHFLSINNPSGYKAWITWNGKALIN